MWAEIDRTRGYGADGRRFHGAEHGAALSRGKDFAMSAAAQVGIKTQSTFTRWLKFNFVGGIGVAVQFAVLFLLKGEFHLHYLWATVIAVEAYCA